MLFIKRIVLIFIVVMGFISCTSTSYNEWMQAQIEYNKLNYPEYDVENTVSLRDYVVSEDKAEIDLKYEYIKTETCKFKAHIMKKGEAKYPDEAYHEAFKHIQRKLYVEGYNAALIVYKEIEKVDNLNHYNQSGSYHFGGVIHYVLMEVELYKVKE